VPATLYSRLLAARANAAWSAPPALAPVFGMRAKAEPPCDRRSSDRRSPDPPSLSRVVWGTRVGSQAGRRGEGPPDQL